MVNAFHQSWTIEALLAAWKVVIFKFFLSIFSLIQTRKTPNSDTFHAATIKERFFITQRGDKLGYTSSKFHVGGISFQSIKG